MKTKLHPVERNVGIREKCESSRLHVCEKIYFTDLLSYYSIYDKEYIGRITEHFGSR